jgi:hypothetical protein
MEKVQKPSNSICFLYKDVIFYQKAPHQEREKEKSSLHRCLHISVVQGWELWSVRVRTPWHYIVLAQNEYSKRTENSISICLSYCNGFDQHIARQQLCKHGTLLLQN